MTLPAPGPCRRPCCRPSRRSGRPRRCRLRSGRCVRSDVVAWMVLLVPPAMITPSAPLRARDHVARLAVVPPIRTSSRSRTSSRRSAHVRVPGGRVPSAVRPIRLPWTTAAVAVDDVDADAVVAGDHVPGARGRPADVDVGDRLGVDARPRVRERSLAVGGEADHVAFELALSRSRSPSSGRCRPRRSPRSGFRHRGPSRRRTGSSRPRT